MVYLAKSLKLVETKSLRMMLMFVNISGMSSPQFRSIERLWFANSYIVAGILKGRPDKALALVGGRPVWIHATDFARETKTYCKWVLTPVPYMSLTFELHVDIINLLKEADKYL